MKNRILILFIIGVLTASGQEKGWLSLGVRNTLNTFDTDGTGIGAGGQFRIRLSDRINTDWFADYISIAASENNIRSDYAHIGWSVLYYLKKNIRPKWQPYILAGHCFDYNKKTYLLNTDISKDRWGAAVQAGAGSHFNVNEKLDISLTTQYMIHLTKSIELEQKENGEAFFESHQHSFLEGHLLVTLSLNYKIVQLFGKNE